MTERLYHYSGPVTGATLEGGREVMLHPGSVVSLPPDNEWVRLLIAKSHLRQVVLKEPAPAGAVMRNDGGPGTGRPAAVIASEELRAKQEEGGSAEPAEGSNEAADAAAASKGKKTK